MTPLSPRAQPQDPLSHIGRSEVVHDFADRGRIDRLAATLDHAEAPWPAGEMPPLGHWLYFQPAVRQSDIGADGHPARSDDGLLPNIDLPRRMWAGGRVSFLAPTPLDVVLTRSSTVVAVAPKVGRSGRMLLVTLRHEVALPGGAVTIVEEQDIVYREGAIAGEPFVRLRSGPGIATPIARTVETNEALLFRYSALTFNAHRIHYDRDYARDGEGYPDLVVQGPLLATLLLDTLIRAQPGRAVKAFDFRAVAPTFVGEAVTFGATVAGSNARLQVVNPAGVAMTATVTFAA